MRSILPKLFALSILLLPGAPVVVAAEGPVPKSKDGIPYPPLVDFNNDILPLFERSCVQCHGPHKASGGLQLTSGAKLMEGGFSGMPIIENNGDASYLIRRLRGLDDEDRMPLDGKAFSDTEIDTVWRWVKQGARVPKANASFEPKPAGIARLTNLQYHNSLRSLLGDKVPLPQDLEPDMIISGSAVVGAARVGTSRAATEKFSRAAFDLAGWAIRDAGFQAKWMACLAAKPKAGKKPKTLPWSDAAEDCTDQFVSRFGRRAWRRPLLQDERVGLVYLAAESANRSQNAAHGLKAALAAMLQSPNFLYRIELGEDLPEHQGWRRLNDFEVATRLSYFLAGTLPDEELLDAAASGKLATLEGLDVHAERLLAMPQARETVRDFFAEFFKLDGLQRTVRSRKGFTGDAGKIAGYLKAETLRVIDSVLFEGDNDFREIFQTDFTFVNQTLAKHYGFQVEIGGDDQFFRVKLPTESSRRGVLSHASFLSRNSGRTSSSPTLRGKFIREQLLCQAVPPPPPNVSNVLPEHPEDGKPRTTRMRLDSHREIVACRACHKAMDPLGMAFEHFDAVGIYRDTENGLTIDASGDLDGESFKDAAELGKLLRHSPRVGTCMVRNLFRFALGTLEGDGDDELITEFAGTLEKSGYRFKSLLLAVAASKGFRLLSVPE
jgi:Protein of unknown function (DUF1592)/Protein of unknown function (DUF1588)/Protein of unknown function (DUF1595)/Protein of unknown function (DUF1585)/Planctomycete cytochrome C/Protein of unknown function (DUF1587)